MTKLCSASFALSAMLLIGCGSADSSEPRALTGVAADQSKRAPANTSAAAPAAAPAAPATDGQPAVNAQGAATLEFQKRIQAYLKIHNEAEGKVPNLKSTDDPQKISDREKALAQAIMTLRAGAKPGEIFAPEYQPYFIKIVKDDFATRSARDRKALVSELPAKMKVDVNTVYPTTIPLATFPPALLRKLPDLPPELEYRIVGRSLLLRDVKANLIVDILRDVVPTIPS
jgi:hypothetical protein